MTATYVLLGEAQLAVKATLAAFDIDSKISEKAILSIALASFHCMWVPKSSDAGAAAAAPVVAHPAMHSSTETQSTTEVFSSSALAPAWTSMNDDDTDHNSVASNSTISRLYDS